MNVDDCMCKARFLLIVIFLHHRPCHPPPSSSWALIQPHLLLNKSISVAKVCDCMCKARFLLTVVFLPFHHRLCHPSCHSSWAVIQPHLFPTQILCPPFASFLLITLTLPMSCLQVAKFPAVFTFCCILHATLQHYSRKNPHVCCRTTGETHSFSPRRVTLTCFYLKSRRSYSVSKYMDRSLQKLPAVTFWNAGDFHLIKMLLHLKVLCSQIEYCCLFIAQENGPVLLFS